MSSESILPLGKLPPELLERLIKSAPISDERILLGPGIGLDCAVIDMGSSLLVFKTEPITFVTDNIGWYAVQIAANDIATTGAVSRWYLATLLLPERRTTPAMVDEITRQATQACQELHISLIGGHTEVTYGLDRPILVGTLIGEVAREKLITPKGSQTGDVVLLTKGVPIEATAILAREFPDRISGKLSAAEIQTAQNFLYHPGISIFRDAQIATSAGRVTAMHDPTEGGLAAGLWELAQASEKCLTIQRKMVSIPPLSMRICQIFDLNPLETIASGALLLTAVPGDAENICSALQHEGIDCTRIGQVREGPAEVWLEDENELSLLPRPERDAITRVYE